MHQKSRLCFVIHPVGVGPIFRALLRFHRSSINGSAIKWTNKINHLGHIVNVNLTDGSYSCSFYGSQLWHLNSSGSKSCNVQWKKVVGRILR